MKAGVCLSMGRDLKWVILPLALALLAGGAWGAQRILIPRDMPLPLYASGLGHTGLGEDDLIVTAFFYPPEQIPGDYDLFNMPVYDPPVGVEPSYVEGFLIVGDQSPNPLHVALHNAPGALVPIWFTRVGDWTDIWTVNEMLNQEPLFGWADSYREVQEPADPSKPHGPWHATTVASGVLEDGRSFLVESHATQAWEDTTDAPDCVVHFGP